jgi:hypothetical protein
VKLRDTPRRCGGKNTHFVSDCSRVHLSRVTAIAVQSKHHLSLNCFITTRFRRATRLTLLQKTVVMTKNIGMLLLAIYLILVGITTLFHIGIGAIVMGVVALIAGVLILIGK